MRAILIDPEARTIVEVDHDNSSYKNISKTIEASCFDVVSLARGDTIYVDDEGLLRPNHYFRWVPADHLVILAGKALILGSDNEGDSVDAKISLQEVKDSVRFVTAQQAREMATTESFLRSKNSESPAPF